MYFWWPWQIFELRFKILDLRIIHPNPDFMNTKAIVIIVCLIFIALVFGVFGYTQRIQAEVALTEANNQKLGAEVARAEAERQRIEAEMQRVVAEDNMGKLQTALQELELLKKRCK
jgi:hypothetical protein